MSPVAFAPMTLADAGAAHRNELAVVRSMTTADASWAAALHQTALPHGFFARLGPQFLTAYYESFISSPHAVALVADSPEGPAGMLVGTVRNSSHYSWVLHQRRRVLLRHGLARLLSRPPLLLLFLRTRLGWYAGAAARWTGRSFTRAFRIPDRQGRRGPAVLSHVAVVDAARSSGAGSALVSSFTAAAARAGCDEAVLVTLAGPAGAGAFYRRLGWTLRERHDDHDGRLVECYSRRL